MYLPDSAAPDRAHGDVVVSDTADGLHAIGAAHVALAIWARPTLPIVASLDLDAVDDLSFVLPFADDGDPALLADAHLVAGGYPSAAAATIGVDIAALAGLHRRIADATAITVRLDVIEGDACRRFHADYVSLRMLCTYWGAGTQWCRTATPQTVHDLPTGTIGIFKGRLAMEAPTILHRSPPSHTGCDPRLLLVLDPA
ncbi:hypothetical protein J2Y58_000097 [Sphingomonas sp. BE138]|uniref:DUF1826 domain-containing protein n=1 Tax=Sphingomonas sp. BE138 TaxID=2817845 RepID=UPI002862ABA9|nr:DUF1826 domain-containing protein [Sphingomonas sp. BE138]MDR6786759.1 hypothetical protein [Sphingomonas sp. BE138]